jgi:hypothetical protein
MSALRRGGALMMVVASLALAVCAGCGNTGDSGYSSVQGGSGHAPGAPAPAQTTVRPTATAARQT